METQDWSNIIQFLNVLVFAVILYLMLCFLLTRKRDKYEKCFLCDDKIKGSHYHSRRRDSRTLCYGCWYDLYGRYEKKLKKRS